MSYNRISKGTFNSHLKQKSFFSITKGWPSILCCPTGVVLGFLLARWFPLHNSTFMLSINLVISIVQRLLLNGHCFLLPTAETDWSVHVFVSGCPHLQANRCLESCETTWCVWCGRWSQGSSVDPRWRWWVATRSLGKAATLTNFTPLWWFRLHKRWGWWENLQHQEFSRHTQNITEHVFVKVLFQACSTMTVQPDHCSSCTQICDKLSVRSSFEQRVWCFTKEGAPSIVLSNLCKTVFCTKIWCSSKDR